MRKGLKSGVADEAGEWKSVPNGGGGITTTAPADVGKAISRLLEAYGSRSATTYRDVVGFHVFYERIHPFLDGNGRTGRMIMFRECLRNGLVPFIVLDAEKEEYYRSIMAFENDDGDRFVQFAERMADLYLDEFSSLIPQNLLLPPLEARIKEPSFSESDLDGFFSPSPRDHWDAATAAAGRPASGGIRQEPDHGTARRV